MPRWNVRRRSGVVTCATLGAILGASTARAADDVVGNLMLVNDNGAWSWFEDERAIIDPANGNVLVGSIGNAAGSGGASRDGVVDIVSFNLADRRVTRTPLADIQPDDHNTPSLHIRPDGRYLAVYANHGTDRLTRSSVSTNSGDPTVWQALPNFTNPANATYSNVFRLSAEGRTYNFTRTTGFDPNYLVSTDDGITWAHGGKLLRDPANRDDRRPYVKYASNGIDRVHFITTEAHPRETNNGVYHGYMQGGNLYRSDGTLVGALGSAPAASAFTPLLLPDQAVNGTTRNHGWTTDLSLDRAGNPVAVFTSRVNTSTNDHRMYYGRLVRGAWQVNEMAKAGAFLYAAENDYTGLAAINPRDPSTVYISSDINPQNDAALPRYEIFKGVTANNGASWTWTPVTQNSTVDNIRPIIPSWSGGTAVFWMRGTYTTYTNYDLGIVGIVEADGETVGRVRYTDATLANTTLVNGNALTATGPSSDGGQTDGSWHRRTGFGNGNEVFTADERGAENAPMLRTRVLNVAAGEYDVFGYFWANPAENWQVSFGLSEAEMRSVRQDLAEQAAAGDFDTAVVLTGSTVNLYKAYLGRVKLLANGSLSVFIDDSSLSLGASTRTWYDGVGLAAVVPDPTAGALLPFRRPRLGSPALPAPHEVRAVSSLDYTESASSLDRSIDRSSLAGGIPPASRRQRACGLPHARPFAAGFVAAALPVLTSVESSPPQGHGMFEIESDAVGNRRNGALGGC